MKIRYSFYCFLLLIACKDGGGIVSPSENRPLGWSFNQALMAMSFSNGGNTNFAPNSGQVFTYSSGSNQFNLSLNILSCTPISSGVQIDDISVEFAPANCGVGLITFYVNGQVSEIKEYYFITATRAYGATTEILSFGFLGKTPKTGFYSSSDSNLFSGYSISEKRIDGSLKSYNYYYLFNGIISTNASNGFRVTADNLEMINYSNGIKSFKKISIGCCSN